MKTLALLSAALLFNFSTFASSKEYAKRDKLNMSYTVYKYIDALSYGKINGISEVLDPNAKFTVTNGKKTSHYTRSEILPSLQSFKNVQQNCSTSYRIIDLNSTQAVVKVSMQYEGFSRINYLTMFNTPKGWKISNVSSSFI